MQSSLAQAQEEFAMAHTQQDAPTELVLLWIMFAVEMAIHAHQAIFVMDHFALFLLSRLQLHRFQVLPIPFPAAEL